MKRRQKTMLLHYKSSVNKYPQAAICKSFPSCVRSVGANLTQTEDFSFHKGTNVVAVNWKDAISLTQSLHTKSGDIFQKRFAVEEKLVNPLNVPPAVLSECSQELHSHRAFLFTSVMFCSCHYTGLLFSPDTSITVFVCSIQITCSWNQTVSE